MIESTKSELLERMLELNMAVIKYPVPGEIKQVVNELIKTVSKVIEDDNKSKMREW